MPLPCICSNFEMPMSRHLTTGKFSSSLHHITTSASKGLFPVSSWLSWCFILAVSSFQGALRQPCEKMSEETGCLPNNRSSWRSCDCSLINKSVFLMYHMSRSDVLWRKRLLRESSWTWMTHLGLSVNISRADFTSKMTLIWSGQVSCSR